jgi:hypothetical protein
LGVFLQREPINIHPTMGRLGFLATSPIKLNAYRYSSNKPSLAKDPTGLECDKEAEAAALQVRRECIQDCNEKFAYLDYVQIPNCISEMNGRHASRQTVIENEFLNCVFLATIFFAIVMLFVVAFGGFIVALILYLAKIAQCEADYRNKKRQNDASRAECLKKIIKLQDFINVAWHNCASACQRAFCEKLVGAGCAELCTHDPYTYEGSDNWYSDEDGVWQDKEPPALLLMLVYEPCCYCPPPQHTGPFPDLAGCCDYFTWIVGGERFADPIGGWETPGSHVWPPGEGCS